MTQSDERFEDARRAPVRLKKPDPDALPPHSDEAERGILGSILLPQFPGSSGPAECMEACQTCGVNEDWFYDLRHRTTFHSIMRLWKTGVAIDSVTVLQALRDAGQLEAAGGVAYLACHVDVVPSAANILYYIDIVREKYHARRSIQEFSEGISTLMECGRPPSEVLAQVQDQLERLSEQTTVRAEVEIREALKGVIDRIEDGYHRGSAQIVGLTTGIEYIDKVLCGFGGDHGNFNIIAARPNVGKTALAMQVGLHVALDHKWFTPRLTKGLDGQMVPTVDENGKVSEWDEHRGLPVGVFSMEMTTETLIHRTLFQRARADAQRFRSGFARKEDFDKLAKAAAELAKAKIYVDDSEDLTIDELGARARSMARQHGIKLFIIDYLQLLQVGQKRFRPDRVQEMAEISNGLRKLGKALRIPFLVVAQMNREFEKEPNRPPRLSDLRDCGAIEQDADTAAFLYPKHLKGDEEDEFDAMVAQVYGNDWAVKPQRVEWLLVKNRYGPNNMRAELLFQKSSTLFFDFNAWKKEHGFKKPAMGERKSKDEEVPL